jgi:hypothetical protein
VPDDAHAVVDPCDAERRRRAARAELGRCAGRVATVALGDGDLVDRFTLPQRDLTKRARERAVEEKRQVLVDDEGAVGLDADGESGVRKGEALAVGRRRRYERDGRYGQR